MYFDRAYLGGGAVGVEPHRSSISASRCVRSALRSPRCSRAFFKAPSKYAPHVKLPASRARTNDVLSNLVDSGYMTAGQVASARTSPAKIVERRSLQAPDWYLDWAFEEVQRLAEGRGHYVLTARTTVDPELQQLAQEALISTLRQTGTQPGMPKRRGGRTRSQGLWFRWSPTAPCER